MDRAQLTVRLLTAAMLLLTAAGYVFYTSEADQKRSEYYREQTEAAARGELTFSGPYCYADRHPIRLRLIVGVAFVGLVLTWWPGTLVWSIPLVVGNMILYFRWYEYTRRLLVDGASIPAGVGQYLYYANVFDLLAISANILIAAVPPAEFLRLLVRALRPEPKLP